MLTSLNIVVIIEYCFSSNIHSMFIVSCCDCELLVPFVSDRPLLFIKFTLLHVCSGDYVTLLRCVTAVSILIWPLQVLDARRTSTNVLVTRVKMVERVWIKWMHLSATVHLDLLVNFLFGCMAYRLLALSGNRTTMRTLHGTLCSSCTDASRAVFVGKVSEGTR